MRKEAISRLTSQPRSSRSRKSKIAHRLPRTWPPIRCCSLRKHNVSAISVGRHGVINHKISDSTVNDFNAFRISLKVSKPDHCHQPPLLGAARGGFAIANVHGAVVVTISVSCRVYEKPLRSCQELLG